MASNSRSLRSLGPFFMRRLLYAKAWTAHKFRMKPLSASQHSGRQRREQAGNIQVPANDAVAAQRIAQPCANLVVELQLRLPVPARPVIAAAGHPAHVPRDRDHHM